MSESYQPPKETFRLPVFLEAKIAVVKKSVVDCPTCPLFLLCQEGVGGTGYWCGSCGLTGVWIDEPDVTTVSPNDVIWVDCAKHKFERVEKKKLAKCAVCSGQICWLEMEGKTRNHYLFTVHASIDAAARQAALKDYWKMWEKKIAEDKAERKKKAAAR